jgi:hypothetical protein
MCSADRRRREEKINIYYHYIIEGIRGGDCG